MKIIDLDSELMMYLKEWTKKFKHTSEILKLYNKKKYSTVKSGKLSHLKDCDFSGTYFS